MGCNTIVADKNVPFGNTGYTIRHSPVLPEFFSLFDRLR